MALGHLNRSHRLDGRLICDGTEFDEASFQLSEDMDSQRAHDILNAARKSDKMISLIYEFETLGDAERADIAQVIAEMEQNDTIVKDVLDPFGSEETGVQLVSEDDRIVLVPITVEGTMEDINAFADDVRANILPEDEAVYITGEEIINNDVNLNAQEGLKKTEIITVVSLEMPAFGIDLFRLGNR